MTLQLYISMIDGKRQRIAYEESKQRSSKHTIKRQSTTE